jgi:ribonucleoside-diphosphate reductase beta chain
MAGLSLRDMRQYLDYVADRRRVQLGLAPRIEARNPFPFMDLQDVQELTNFFERRVSAYQVGVEGSVAFDHAF